MQTEEHKANRFSSTNQPTREARLGKRGQYLRPILKKLLSADWKFNDPKIKAMLKKHHLKEDIATAVVLRLIMNAIEGDDRAIEDIFDRIDGKVTQKVESEVKVTQMGRVIKDGKPMEFDIGNDSK